MSVPRLISIDVGGTFTDVLNVNADGSVGGFKLPSQEPDGLATVFADTVGQLGSGEKVTVPDAPFVHVFVARGAVAHAGHELTTGSALRLRGGAAVELQAIDDSEIIIWESDMEVQR